MVERGYAQGVPMGGTLKAGGTGAPSFTVWAMKGPRRRQPRSDPDHQGLGRRQRRAAGSRLRRRVVGRSEAGREGHAAAGRQHRRPEDRAVHEHHRQRRADRHAGATRRSIRSRVPSTTSACCRSPRRGGAPTTRSAPVCRCSRTCRQRSRNAPGLRPSGTAPESRPGPGFNFMRNQRRDNGLPLHGVKGTDPLAQ